MPKLFDRVKVNIATTGTGTVTFGSASSNAFLTPTEAGCVDGDTVRYVIVDGTDYEEGIGTIASSVATMARTTVTKSKIGGTAGTTKLNLSGAAVLALVASAADIVNKADVTTVGNALLTAADAAAVQTAAGGTTVGKALFTAADADAAQTAAGGTTVGKALFTAASGAAALTALGLAAGTVQRFTTPGAGTYTPSSTAVRWIRVRMVGGGGGGGGSNASSGQSDVGSGGGGGGYVEHLMSAGTYSFVVGAGGGAQSNGGDTTFNSGSLNAGGGTGAPYNAGSGTGLGRASAAGNGGSATGGNIVNIPGKGGDIALRYSGSEAISAKGGDSHMGFGGRSTTSTNGNVGGDYGGGGGGSAAVNGVARTGGPGANGIIIIDEYF